MNAGDLYTPCLAIPKCLLEAHFYAAADTSTAANLTYDIYSLSTTISDDMMGPIMEQVAEIQEGMRDEIADLRSEVGEITGQLKLLPTKDKLKSLQALMVKTRNQI
jgi:hypothetical protein